MSQTEITAKRGSGDHNREGNAEAIDLADRSDPQATTDPTYVSDGWIVHDSDGGVHGRPETAPHPGDDQRRRTAERRRRADR